MQAIDPVFVGITLSIAFLSWTNLVKLGWQRAYLLDLTKGKVFLYWIESLELLLLLR